VADKVSDKWTAEDERPIAVLVDVLNQFGKLTAYLSLFLWGVSHREHVGFGLPVAGVYDNVVRLWLRHCSNPLSVAFQIAEPTTPKGTATTRKIPKAQRPCPNMKHLRHETVAGGALANVLDALILSARPRHRNRDRQSEVAHLPAVCAAGFALVPFIYAFRAVPFLFFGLYRQVEETAQGRRFIKGAPDLHVLWGWLQVDQKYTVADLGPNDLPWARHHPHLYSKYRDDRNTVYAASTKLELGGDDDGREIAGWGVFRKFDQRLVLTDPHGAGVSN